MPAPLTGWISESGASESDTSTASAPPMSASSPVRQMRLCTYESSTLRSSDSCGSSLVACFCRILPMLLAAEPSIARPTAKLCDASAADGNSVAGVGVDGTA